MDDAICAEVTPDIFFPETGNAFTRQAKAICAECPVRQICLEYSFEHDIWFGIWGGLTPAERRRAKRRER
jgi:WhiB family redox-sensing transcriptional regulator